MSWLAVALWSAAIYVSVPFVRMLSEFVLRYVDRSLFTWAVLAALAAVALITARWLRRRPGTRPADVAWLAAIGATFAALTLWLGQDSPEEAVHFLQYGPLGLLLFRAFAHRTRDYGIYPAAALVGAVIGLGDEVLQWLTPGRYFGLHDVWLNAGAVALVLLALAQGIRPPYIAGWPGPAARRRLCRLAALAVTLLGLCLLNTPARVAWYSERLPALAWLTRHANVMAEYGHRHVLPGVATFNSRLDRADLAATDRARAVTAAAILDRYDDPARYADFLADWPPHRDPFVHEARVHLFRRDDYLSAAWRSDDPQSRRDRFAVAWGENRIMESAFGATLAASRYRWPDGLRARIAGQLGGDAPYRSKVSRGLITAVSQRQVAWATLIGALGLLLLGWWTGRRRR